MDSLKIATWNVNSVRARLERLLQWLADSQPDLVCLQELKATEGQFPFDPLRQLGYHSVVFGKKTYNGVGILARTEVTEVERGFEGDVDNPEARFMAATVKDVRILSAYVPNGREVDSDAYLYKLEWLRCLKKYLKSCILASRSLVLCGDLNMAPEDRDVARPAEWEGSVLFNEELRKEFADLLALGLADTFRQHHKGGDCYSWWDYRQLAFPRNDGLRIDHILATPMLAECCTQAGIDRQMRKGTKPSDHAPVWAVFEGR